MTKSIQANGLQIHLKKVNQTDYFSLTDLAKFQSEDSKTVIRSWLRTKSTMSFLAAWETMYNPDFKAVNYDVFKNTSNLSISPSKWIESTNAIGIQSKRGRYNSGTYAHKDIAMEFITWLSPTLKLYAIQEFQRLKDNEPSSKIANDEWNVQRALAKSNSQLQTDAIQSHLTQEDTIQNPHFVYASEADLINVIVYNMTAKQFRELNPDLPKSQNMRDLGTKLQASLVANLELINSKLISQGKSRTIRAKELRFANDRQVAVFTKRQQKKKLKK